MAISEKKKPVKSIEKPCKPKISKDDNVSVENTAPFDLSKVYKGGSDKWLVMSLSEDTSVEEHYKAIVYEIRDIFGPEISYFLPVYKEKVSNKDICFTLFDGYAFVQEPIDGFKSIDFNKLKATHITHPLMKGTSYNYVSNKDINNFKKDLKVKIKSMMPKIGQRVIPKEGVFKDLEGEVIAVNKDTMMLTVRFEASSRVVEAPVSFINVEYI